MNLILCTALALVGLDKSAGRLNEYVAKPDSTYQWEVRATEKQQGIEITQIKMVSQTWHGITWKHFVYIMKPEKITVPGHAMLFITGGGWNESFDKPAAQNADIDDLPEEGLALARQAGMPVVAISHVPFQPMFNGLVEDEIISKTFVEYLETRDPSWPLLFPWSRPPSARWIPARNT